MKKGDIVLVYTSLPGAIGRLDRLSPDKRQISWSKSKRGWRRVRDYGCRFVSLNDKS